MSWPATLAQVTLTVDLSMLPGMAERPFTVVFLPPSAITVAGDNSVIVPASRVVTSETGTPVTVVLPPTDDAQASPVGWKYRVTIQCGETVIRGVMALPAANATADFAALFELSGATVAGETYVLLSAVGADDGVAPLVGGEVPAEYLPAGQGGDPAWDDITGKPTTFDTTRAKVTDASTLGRTLMAVADAAAARTAIGAGTSSLGLGTSSTTAYRGDLGAAATAGVADHETRIDALEAGGGGGGSTVVVKHGYVNTGDVTIQNTGGAWAMLTGGPTFQIDAVAGDEIQFDVAALKAPAADLFWDYAVVVSGAAVRYASTGGATPAIEGDPSMYPDQGSFRSNQSMGMNFTAASGDISGGKVTIGFALKSANTTGKLFAGTNYPLRWRLINYGASA